MNQFHVDLLWGLCDCETSNFAKVRLPALEHTDALTVQDEDGSMQPIYKYYKRYPLGYSG